LNPLRLPSLWPLPPIRYNQTGLKSILHAVLILVESGGGGGEINAAGIFHSRPILPVPQQPAILWTNGCHRRIQRIKLVYKQSSTLF